MVVKINDIILTSFTRVESETIDISTKFQFEKFEITNTNDDVLLVDANTNKVHVKELTLDKAASVRVRIEPNTKTRTKGFEIVLVSDKTNENIRIVGRLIVRNIISAPIVEITAKKNCNPSLANATFKLLLDQNKNATCNFTFSSPGMVASPETITQFETRSKNGIGIGSDISKINSAVAITFTASGDTATFDLTLTNPNFQGHPLENYGFVNETEYIINFQKTFTINGDDHTITFFINLTFRGTPTVITVRRIQTATLNIFNPITLVVFDFQINANAEPSQFTFGFDKTFSIPTRVNTIIPRALRFPLDQRFKPLELFILAESIAKSVEHYSLKLIVEIQPVPNRDLVPQLVDVPFFLGFRGSKNKFNLPVRLLDG